MKKRILSLIMLVSLSGCNETLYISDVEIASGKNKAHNCDTAGSFCKNAKYDAKTGQYTVTSTLEDGSILTRTFSSSKADPSTSNPVYKETSNTITCPDGTTKTYGIQGSNSDVCVTM